MFIEMHKVISGLLKQCVYKWRGKICVSQQQSVLPGQGFTLWVTFSENKAFESFAGLTVSVDTNRERCGHEEIPLNRIGVAVAVIPSQDGL